VRVFLTLWTEGFADLSDAVLEAAFRKTLKTARFWPVKVADVLEHVSRAETNATDEAAEKEWSRVLDIRRRLWNPDIPGPFDRAVAALPESTRRAARASGVFRDHETVEALHVWAKKKFVESFTRFFEAGEEKNLLPDGELKNLLADVSTTKALPPAPVADLHARGVEYGEKLRLVYEWKETAESLPEWDAETRQQISQELAGYGERFVAALKNRKAAP